MRRDVINRDVIIGMRCTGASIVRPGRLSRHAARGGADRKGRDQAFDQDMQRGAGLRVGSPPAGRLAGPARAAPARTPPPVPAARTASRRPPNRRASKGCLISTCPRRHTDRRPYTVRFARALASARIAGRAVDRRTRAMPWLCGRRPHQAADLRRREAGPRRGPAQHLRHQAPRGPHVPRARGPGDTRRAGRPHVERLGSEVRCVGRRRSPFLPGVVGAVRGPVGRRRGSPILCTVGRRAIVVGRA